MSVTEYRYSHIHILLGELFIAVMFLEYYLTALIIL